MIGIRVRYTINMLGLVGVRASTALRTGSACTVRMLALVGVLRRVLSAGVRVLTPMMPTEMRMRAGQVNAAAVCVLPAVLCRVLSAGVRVLTPMMPTEMRLRAGQVNAGAVRSLSAAVHALALVGVLRVLAAAVRVLAAAVRVLAAVLCRVLSAGVRVLTPMMPTEMRLRAGQVNAAAVLRRVLSAGVRVLTPMMPTKMRMRAGQVNAGAVRSLSAAVHALALVGVLRVLAAAVRVLAAAVRVLAAAVRVLAAVLCRVLSAGVRVLTPMMPTEMRMRAGQVNAAAVRAHAGVRVLTPMMPTKMRMRAGQVNAAAVRAHAGVRVLTATLLLAVLCVPTNTAAAREAYVSNAIGIAVRALPPDAPVAQSEYVLIVNEDDTIRTEQLYHNGTLVRRVRLVTANRKQTEFVYANGVLTDENVYDANERVLSAKRYNAAEELISVVTYVHSKNSVTATHLDGMQQEIFREERQIDQLGRVIRITRNYISGDMEDVQFIFLDRQLLREIHTLNALTVNIHYDAAGRITKEVYHLDQEFQREISYVYSAQHADRIANYITDTTMIDGVLHRREQTNNDAGEETMRLLYEDGVLVEESSFEYSNGRIARSRIHRTGSTSRQQLIYDQNGAVKEEQWYDNGVIVRVVFPQGKNRSMEVRYIDGSPYVRVYFEKNIRKKEEFVIGDTVIRERVFE